MIFILTIVGNDVSSTILSKMQEGLKGVENQPETSERYSGMESGPATYGVVKRLRDNDMDLHTDKQVTVLIMLTTCSYFLSQAFVTF